MRVTDQSLILSYLSGIRRSREDVERALAQLADGKRVRRASDDPSAAAVALELRARAARLAGFQRSGGLARHDLDTADDTLGEAVALLTSARTLALAGASTPAQSANEARAREVESLREQLLLLANTAPSGRSLFAGTATLTRPFDDTGSYAGNDAEVQVPLDADSTVGATLSGRRVFLDGGDVFAALDALATALRDEDTAAIDALVTSLGSQIDHVNAVRADLGTRLGRIEATAERQAAESLRLARRISEIEDVELERVVTDLAAANGTFEALSAGAARVLGRSLFDFLG